MSEFRKHRRVELNYAARVLSLGADLICDCAIIDVSQGGARIAVLSTEIVPDEFFLAFSASGGASRRCRVAWRRDDEIGATFVKSVDSAAARRARLLATPCP